MIIIFVFERYITIQSIGWSSTTIQMSDKYQRGHTDFQIYMYYISRSFNVIVLVHYFSSFKDTAIKCRMCAAISSSSIHKWQMVQITKSLPNYQKRERTILILKCLVLHAHYPYTKCIIFVVKFNFLWI